MDPIRFVHTADFHLGAAFSRFPQLADKLRQDQLEAWLDVVRHCRNEAIPLLLIAGDLFDTPRPDPRLVEEVKDMIADLEDTHVFIAPGNHDPADPDSPWLVKPWPKQTHIFAGPLSSVQLPEHAVMVHGAGFSSPAATRPLIDPQNPLSLPQDRMNVLLVHGEIVRSGQSSAYNPIDAHWLGQSQFDYAALGHWHQGFLPEQIVPEGPWHAYPGCPVGRGFDETNVQGILSGSLVPIDLPTQETRDFRVDCEATFESIAKRQFRDMTVRISDAQHHRDVLACVEKALVTQSNFRKTDAYRIRLVGNVSAESFSRTLLESSLQERLFHVSVIDETREPFDLDILAQEHSLAGAFVRQVLGEDPPDYESLDDEKKSLILIGLQAFEQEVHYRENP